MQNIWNTPWNVLPWVFLSSSFCKLPDTFLNSMSASFQAAASACQIFSFIHVLHHWKVGYTVKLLNFFCFFLGFWCFILKMSQLFCPVSDFLPACCAPCCLGKNRPAMYSPRSRAESLFWDASITSIVWNNCDRHRRTHRSQNGGIKQSERGWNDFSSDFLFYTQNALCRLTSPPEF